MGCRRAESLAPQHSLYVQGASKQRMLPMAGAGVIDHTAPVLLSLVIAIY